MILLNEILLLQHGLAESSIQDAVRKSERLPLPPESLMIQFNGIANDVMTKMSDVCTCHQRDMVEFFGAPTIVIAKLWELIVENCGGDDTKISKEHLLWALHCMKQAPNITNMCKTMKRNGKDCPVKRTVIKWIWHYVFEIFELKDKLIVWEHRKTNDMGNDCLVSVDCTNCPFQQILIDNPENGKKMVDKALYSCKINGPALRCEVAVSLQSDDIVWINGPFCPGDWNDIEIFWLSLLGHLEIGERVEADDICVAEAPAYVICPKSCTTTEHQESISKRVQGRHEVLNKQIKHWKCINGKFDVRGTAQEKMDKHQALFYSCAIMKQLAMQMGVGELYEVYKM